MGVPKVLADLRTLVGGIEPDRPIVGILAFEAAAAMARLVCLHCSLADDEVRRLRGDMRSQGVAYLTSKDQSFLLRLACAELMSDLDKAAAAVSILALKCRDPLLRGFERFYADLRTGGEYCFLRGGGRCAGDMDRLGLASTEKGIEKRVRRMERYVAATSQLYEEMEALNELESSEKQLRYSGPIPKQKPAPSPPADQSDMAKLELRTRRCRVRQLKEESLWNRTFDKAVELLFRAVVTVFARICAVFGPYVLMLRAGTPDYNGKHASGPMERTPQKMPKKPPASFLSNSAPLLVSNGVASTPLVNLSKLMDAGSKTVGGAGLGQRYAKMILLAQNLLTPSEDEEEEEERVEATREELYEMMPAGMRAAVRTKLREWWRREGGRMAEDASMAEGWREALAAILAWLGPVAEQTMRWQEERNMERQQRFCTRPRVLLLQTLHFSDVEKTEAAVVEVLVGLSCMLCYEERQRESLRL